MRLCDGRSGEIPYKDEGKIRNIKQSKIKNGKGANKNKVQHLSCCYRCLSLYTYILELTCDNSTM